MEQKFKGKFICTYCGYVGKPKRKTRGNFFIELILWLVLIVPGVIYSIWRLSTRYYVCPKCGSETMIPLDTPKGRQLYEEQLNRK